MGVLMLLFPLIGFSIFSFFYTAGTICTLGSFLFLMEHRMKVKINDMVEAKVKAIVNNASTQIRSASRQLEIACNKYLDDSTLEAYVDCFNSDIGGILQGLCVLLYPKLGLLLLTLTAVVDVGEGTRKVLVLVGFVGFGGLAFACLGGFAALIMGGLGGLGDRVFRELDGLAFLVLGVLGGVAALGMGGLGGFCALSVGGLSALTLSELEKQSVTGKGPFGSSSESTAIVLGLWGSCRSVCWGLGCAGSVGLGEWRDWQDMHRATLQYFILATVLWFWGPALFLLLLKLLIWAVVLILQHCPKSVVAILCFIFGAGCTIMGVYLRFLPGFALLLFGIFYTVGNAFMLESAMLLEDFTKRVMIYDNTRRTTTILMLVS
ncbi:hypothetical protein WMY93_024324 [Mugilogobius chulae]|uniref:Uncharacterized protein n=1 Tax=Mugilogobius chulae TaxID=88201 RepID=A0AAW0NB75_9GOBI